MTQCWTFDSSISFLKPFLIVIKLFHNCYCFLFKPANNNLLSWSNYKIIVFPIFAARGKVDSTFDTIQSDQQKGEQHTTTPPTLTNFIYWFYLLCLLSAPTWCCHEVSRRCGVVTLIVTMPWHIATSPHTGTAVIHPSHSQGKWHLICLKGETGVLSLIILNCIVALYRLYINRHLTSYFLIEPA